MATFSILHLSDLHISSHSQDFVSRGASIGRAFSPHLNSAGAGAIIFSGDVANTGRADEYKVAEAFLAKISETISADGFPGSVPCHVVPGNHDCDFSDSSQARSEVIEARRSSAPPRSFDRSVLELCLGPQSEFWDFVGRLNGGARPAAEDKVVRHSTATIGKTTLQLTLVNTAMSSSLKESPNTLLFPLELLKWQPQSADLVIAVLHHPFSWFHGALSRDIRKAVEGAADIILTGHEHVPDAYAKSRPGNRQWGYLEAEALRSPQSDESGFNVLNVDLDARRVEIRKFEWRQGLYRETPSPLVWALPSGPRGSRLSLREEFRRSLLELGLSISHSAKPSLSLPDVFVYPDLIRQKPTESTAEASPLQTRSVSSDAVLEFVQGEKRVIISGSERSGRTALAKKLVLDMLDAGLFPIFTDGDGFKKSPPRPLERALRRLVAAQYGDDAWDEFSQLPRQSRVLVVDDWDIGGATSERLSKSLGQLTAYFERIVLFVSEAYSMQALSGGPDHPLAPEGFLSLEIAPLNNRLRGKLVERWMRIGDSYDGEERVVVQRIDHAEAMLRNLVGRGVMPSYPMFCLIALQAIEAGTDIDTRRASLGYYYELLINASLIRVEFPMPLDAVRSLCAELAYSAFSGQRRVLSSERIGATILEFEKRLALRVPREHVLEALEEAMVLKRMDGGEWCFRYRYVYCYFVGLRMQLSLNDEARRVAVREDLHRLVKHMYVQDYSNILIAFLYLTQDASTLDAIVASARSQYQEHPPSDCASSFAFASPANQEPFPLALPSGSATERRERRRDSIDEAERHAGQGEPGEREAVDDNHPTDGVVRINAAYKTIQVLGQILRTSTGTLVAQKKEEIAHECMLLSLRILESLTSAVKANWSELSQALRKRVHDEPSESPDPPDAREKAERILFILMALLSYSTIKHLSQSMGSRHALIPIRNATESLPGLSGPLTMLSVQLDHGDGLPQEEVRCVYDATEGSMVGRFVVRMLVREFLLLYDAKFKVRQQICNYVGIASNDPQILSGNQRLV